MTDFIDVVSSFAEANSRLSEVEKGRAAAQDRSQSSKYGEKFLASEALVHPSFGKGGFNQDRSPTKEYRARDRDGSGLSDLLGGFNLDNQRHTPRSLSSTGSSLRPLNDSQRSKLQQFQDDFRQEMSEKKASAETQSLERERGRRSTATPATKPRLEFPMEEGFCERCGLSKNKRCVCAAMEKRIREWDFGSSTKNGNSLLPPSASSAERVKISVERETQTDFNASANEPKKNLDISCQVSKVMYFTCTCRSI